jgi:hypothetical protein
VQMLRISARRLRATALTLAFALGSLTLLWGSLAVFLPDDVGRALLGSTWPAAHAILVPMTLVFMTQSAAAAASVGLRAVAAAQRSLRASAMGSTLIVLGGTLGGAFGAAGAAWGLALMGAMQAAFFWRQFNVALTEHVVDQARAERLATRHANVPSD